MPTTVVKCSLPQCQKVATQKIAAPWTGGRFAELKTYGFACPAHAETVAAEAHKRRGSDSLSAGETVGEIGVYAL